MSLKKKIVLSFLVSACMIALLSAFLYLNFVEIKKETTFLELTDTLRSKSLQLRRHEKNYFLYAPEKAPDETKAIHTYLDELESIAVSIKPSRLDRTQSLKDLIREYRQQFSAIERLVSTLSDESEHMKKTSPAYAKVGRIVEGNFLDRPLEDVRYLQEVFSIHTSHTLISSLKALDAEIIALRKTGETILTASKELDRNARDKVDNFIHISRIAILVAFPLFVLIGFGTILVITGNIVKRLQLLTNVVERTGKGNFSQMQLASDQWTGNDEVEILIRKFNEMEEQLLQREKELLQSKKLAAIGTLAAGVAHELNNPLNNIYLSAQVLQREAGEACSPFIMETLNDIVDQSLRVKRIVGDLLEYARGRDLQRSLFDLNELVRNVYELLKPSVDMEGIHLQMESKNEKVSLNADQEQLKRVFINLFSNAVEAMSGKGDIIVTVADEEDAVKIWVSDTGKGIPAQDMDKVFEPFFTTKDKGTGLGLAIVYSIIKKHKGEIMVDSEQDKGTTFYILLPRGDYQHGA